MLYPTAHTGSSFFHLGCKYYELPFLKISSAGGSGKKTKQTKNPTKPNQTNRILGFSVVPSKEHHSAIMYVVYKFKVFSHFNCPGLCYPLSAKTPGFTAQAKITMINPTDESGGCVPWGQ